jgi:hypothetical protein
MCTCFLGNGDKAVSRISSQRPGRPGLGIPTGTGANISPVSSPVLRLTLSFFQWTPVTLVLSLKRRGLNLTPYLYLLQRHRVTAATAVAPTVFHALHSDNFFRFSLLLF